MQGNTEAMQQKPVYIICFAGKHGMHRRYYYALYGIGSCLPYRGLAGSTECIDDTTTHYMGSEAACLIVD